MSINSFPVGHKFNTYKLSIDENTSNLFTKAILNRTNDFHSPFSVVSVALGMLLEEVELGDYCLIGANAMILKGTKIPSNSFVFGVPGEIHPLTDKQHEMLNMVTRAFERLIAMYKKNGV